MNTKFEISKDFLSSLQWIRLDDLFNLPYEDLPQWVWTSNVVYYCRNTHNGKGYVGETRQCLVDRWRGEGLMNHQSHIQTDDKVIYKALRKYTPNKFILTIIQTNFESDQDRKSSEIHWIKQLYTHVSKWGYNMTLGYNDVSRLNNKKLELYPETNGAPPQWIRSGYKRMLELYPETNGMPPGMREAGLLANKIKYNLGGANPFWIKAGKARQKELYPETNGMPPQCIEAGTISHSINSIISAINRYKDYLLNKNLDITPYNYANCTYLGSRIKKTHIPRVLKWLDKLKTSPKWENWMDELFSHYVIENNKVIII